ncbi:MAG: sugar phosphate nucleotidyltransferase [Pyrinomonadaceae bacterium]
MATVSSASTVSPFRPARPAFHRDDNRDRWAVILAGGDGNRLRSMTRSIAGDDRPKQFCRLIGGRTLLDQTRARVARSVRPERTLLVVTEKHRRFFHPVAATLDKDLLVAQPESKGTAPAIIYALQRVAAKDPQAIVSLFPSDHYFADDEAFMMHVDAAYDAVEGDPQTVVLLGITPESPEVEFGWIEPHHSIFGDLPGSVTRVRRFWEKPSVQTARELLGQGCLWNSFVMVGHVNALLKMTKQSLGNLNQAFTSIAMTFGTPAEPQAVRRVYAQLTESNFSHEVLAARPEDLTVMRVGNVGWSDLGEPSRVLSTWARAGIRTELAQTAS